MKDDLLDGLQRIENLQPNNLRQQRPDLKQNSKDTLTDSDSLVKYPQHGRRLCSEDTSIETERLRPNNTAPKAVKKRLGLWEGPAFSALSLS